MPMKPLEAASLVAGKTEGAAHCGPPLLDCEPQIGTPKFEAHVGHQPDRRSRTACSRMLLTANAP